MADESYNFSSDALPEQVRTLLRLLIEGGVADLCFVATTPEGNVLQGIWAEIEGKETHPYTMLGAIETLKFDWTQGFIPLRADMTPGSVGGTD